MKKSIILALLFALALAAVAFGPGGEPPIAAGQAYHFSFAGKGADAGWTTCPSGPSSDAVCTDTYVGVAEQVYKEDGIKFLSTTLYLYEYSYKLDRKGNWITVSDAYGYGGATLSIDNKLTSASASATIPLNNCTVDRHGNYTCQESGVVTVEASWAGQGDLIRSNGTNHSVSKGFTYNSHSWGTYRDATAGAQVNGSDLGTAFYGSMYDSRWSDVYITHRGQ